MNKKTHSNKNYIFTTMLLLCSLSMYSQSDKVAVFYKNGDSIQGYVNQILYEQIKFSLDIDGKYKWMESDGLDKLIIYSKKGTQEWHYLNYKKKEKSTTARVVKQIQETQQKSTLGDLDSLSSLKDNLEEKGE